MTKEMTNSAMLLEAFQKMLELCNNGSVVKFEQDLGKNTLTVCIDDNHTHIGIPELNDEAFDVLVKNLYYLFTDGPHLSWVKE